jgi:hypothetical protein
MSPKASARLARACSTVRALEASGRRFTRAA